MMRRRRFEVTVSAAVPKGMSAAHFRRLIRDQINGGGGVYLSIADQLEADTNAGQIRPRVSGARRAR